MKIVAYEANKVRLRLSAREHAWVQAPWDLAAPADWTPAPAAPPFLELPPASLAACAPTFTATRFLPHKPVIAILEAVPAGADELAAAAVAAVERLNGRCGVLCLDQQNRLGPRLGCAAQSEPSLWKQAAPALSVSQGSRRIIPAPTSEGDLQSPDVAAVLQHLCQNADAVVALLGCRWSAKLFRPVLSRATHIWCLTRSGRWSGAEMRLEQAEFSGWTDMGKFRLVVVGDAVPVPPNLSSATAAVLAEPLSETAGFFVIDMLGRVTA